MSLSSVRSETALRSRLFSSSRSFRRFTCSVFSPPERYTYAEQCSYLFALWEKIGLGDKVILVLHDWGSAMGFDWANKNRDRVQGIVYMEAIVTPLTWADWPENARRVFQGFRSESGEELILEKNVFVERVLPNSVIRQLSEAEMAAYRKPFARPGEDRRPTLTWPRMIPIEGNPADVVKVVENYGAWSPLPRSLSCSSMRIQVRFWSAGSGNFAAPG
jgi:haloalkane dehalogenase